jgi:hypothetical protein
MAAAEVSAWRRVHDMTFDPPSDRMASSGTFRASSAMLSRLSS